MASAAPGQPAAEPPAAVEPAGDESEPEAPVAGAGDDPAPISDKERAYRKAALGSARIAVGRVMGALASNLPCKVSPSGQVGPTPPLTYDCARGPRGECWPASAPSKDWEYPESLWDDPAWLHAEYRPVEGHSWHLALSWSANEHGYNGCDFRITAFGDYDGDGAFTTYSAWPTMESEEQDVQWEAWIEGKETVSASQAAASVPLPASPPGSPGG